MDTKKTGFFANLSEKDKTQMSYFGMIFVFLIIVFGGFLLTQTLDTIDEETERYKKSLELIAAEGPAYLERNASAQKKESHKNLSDEQLSNNTIKLTSFVAKIAEKEDVKIDSYDEKEIPFSNEGSGPIVTEHRLTAKVYKTKMDKLVRFLDAIEKSKDPVFIQRIDIRKKGKKPNDIKATILVSTFSKAKEEG